jgi:hypothetical protein
MAKREMRHGFAWIDVTVAVRTAPPGEFEGMN